MSEFLQERVISLRREAEAEADVFDDGMKEDRWEWKLADEIERLIVENHHMKSVLNRLHAAGGIVAYSGGEWLVIGGKNE